MKKFFKNCLFWGAMLVSTGLAMTSCSESENTVTPPGGGGGGVNPPGAAKVSLTWETDETAGSDYGVKIIAGVTSANQLKFECIPGDYAKSYRLDVIPLSKAYDMIYSTYYNEIINNGKLVTDEESKAFLKELLFSESGAAGFTFAEKNANGEPLLDDYWTGHEFNWGADGYAQFTIVPNAEYLVVAVGCEDELGANGRDMSILHITTTNLGLIGNPEVTVSNLQTGWSAFGVDFEANEDAKYYYNLAMLSSAYDNYIRDFGEDMFREMIRFSVYPSSTDNPNGMFFTTSVDESAIAEEHIVLTVATDENYVPGDIVEYRFNMPQKPENTVIGEATAHWDSEKTSSSVANFTFDLDKYTKLVRYRVMDKISWEGTYANDSAKRAELAFELYNEGWGEYNPNFKMEGEGADVYPTGEAGTVKSWQYILRPNTEQVVAYIAINGYEEYSEIKTLDFTTDPLNATFTSGASMKVTAKSGKNDVLVSFEPDENICLYYYKLVEEKKLDWDWNSELLYNDIMAEDMFYFTYPYEYEAGTTEDTENKQFDFVGLQPNTKYYLLYVAEDWNGVLTAPKYIEVNTLALEAGDNPRMTITATTSYNELFGYDELDVTFTPLEDVGFFYYGTFDCLATDHATLTSYAEAKKYWTNLVLNGPDGAGNNFIGYNEITQNIRMQFFGGKDPNLKYKVAAAIPFGAADKQGDLVLVYYDIDENKVISDLTELWDDAPVPMATASLKANKPMSMTRAYEANEAKVNKFLSKFQTAAKKSGNAKQIKLNMVQSTYEDFLKSQK